MEKINLTHLHWPSLRLFCLAVAVFFITAGCSRSVYIPLTPYEVTPVPYEEQYPEPKCTIDPANRVVTLSETHVNLVVDISSADLTDTLKVFVNGEQVYECSTILTDQITGEGDIFIIPIERSGATVRFESSGSSDIWEELIVPDQTDLYTNDLDESFEYFYAFVSFWGDGSWRVQLTSEHFGYE